MAWQEARGYVIDALLVLLVVAAMLMVARLEYVDLISGAITG